LNLETGLAKIIDVFNIWSGVPLDSLKK
jgi:hypothetical protein